MAPTSNGQPIIRVYSVPSAATGDSMRYETTGRIWHEAQPFEQVAGDIRDGKIYVRPNS